MDYHENWLITLIYSLSILVHKNIRIKIHFHQLRREKIRRHTPRRIWNLVKHLKLNFWGKLLTDLQKALRFHPLSIFAKTFILDV